MTFALDKHAPIKTAVHRGKNKPHVHREMRKAIMKRTRLKNIANKTKSQDDLSKGIRYSETWSFR